MSGTWQAWCVACDGVALRDGLGCVGCRVRDQQQIRALRTNGPIATSAFCAICVDDGTELRGAQLEEGGPVFTICQRCDQLGATPSGPTTRRNYMPIDETLGRMRVRVLRALRHFDWTSTDELVWAIGIEEQAERASYRRTLADSVRRGLVECDRRERQAWRYRITPAGRQSYAAALRRNAA